MKNGDIQIHIAALIGLVGLLGGCTSLTGRPPALSPVAVHTFESLPSPDQRAGEPLVDDLNEPVVAPVLSNGFGLGDIKQIDTIPTAPTDMWARMRAGFAVDSPASARIEKLAQQYAARRYLESVGARASPMLYHVVAEVERQRLPLELALIPFVESAFDPHARSPVGAHGPWQFMPRTGRDYGLTADRFGDRRRDWIASTRAALDYLQHLHRLFDGDWQLAMAAYNCGEALVERARKRAAAVGKPLRFEHLSLPAETREYVPRVFALKRLIEAPQVFGASLPSAPDMPSLRTIKIKRDVDVVVAARLAEISEAQFRAFNPSITGPLIPAALHSSLLLPAENAAKWDANIATESGPLANWGAHRIGRAATALELSTHLRVDKAALLAANPLPAGHRYGAGSMILVPRRGPATDISPDQLAAAVLSTEPMQRKVTVRLKKRDSYERIARRYGVTLTQLNNWNPGISSTKPKLGQRLNLWLPVVRAAKRV